MKLKDKDKPKFADTLVDKYISEIFEYIAKSEVRMAALAECTENAEKIGKATKEEIAEVVSDLIKGSHFWLSLGRDHLKKLHKHLKDEVFHN